MDLVVYLDFFCGTSPRIMYDVVALVRSFTLPVSSVLFCHLCTARCAPATGRNAICVPFVAPAYFFVSCCISPACIPPPTSTLCCFVHIFPPSLPPSHRTTHVSCVVSAGSSCKNISWVLIPSLLVVCSMPPFCQTRHIGRRERETANSPHPRRQRTRLGPAEDRSRARRRRKRKSLEGKATRFNSLSTVVVTRGVK